MSFSGADADQLDHVGVRLESTAQSLRSKSQRLRASLNAAPWKGRGADRFRHDFNSVHARSLADAARFLDDAYETLTRNAQEQRDASGSGRAGVLHRFDIMFERVWGRLGGPFGWIEDRPWWSRPPLPFPIPPLFPWIPRFEPPMLPLPSFPVIPFYPPRLPDFGWLLPGFWFGEVIGGRETDGAAGASSPAPESGARSQKEPASPTLEQSPAHRPSDGHAGSGVHDSLGRSIGWREAQAIVDRHTGESARAAFDHHDYNGTGGDWYQCTSWAKARWREMGYDGPPWYGDGNEVAHKINQMLKRPDEHHPSPGAIVSFTSGTPHVAVVEEVRTNSQGVTEFRVSEMNMGNNTWQIAMADEYRDNRWVTLDSTQVFASFPG